MAVKYFVFCFLYKDKSGSEVVFLIEYFIANYLTRNLFINFNLIVKKLI